MKRDTDSRHSKLHGFSVQVFDDSSDEDAPASTKKAPHYHTTCVSAAGKLSQKTTSTVAPASPVKKKTAPLQIRDDFQASDNVLDPLQEYEFLRPEFFSSWDEEHGSIEKERVRPASSHPLRQWLLHDRDLFLSEMIRLDGRGPYTNKSCPSCSCAIAHYRCVDCFDGRLFCQSCSVHEHMSMPFHRIENWNGTFFERVTLKQMGLRIQLGHPVGEDCVNPERAWNNDFIVLDSNGIHEVALYFCGCETAKRPAVQLMRARLYPATGTNPKTAATFRILKQFHLLSFESKCSGYEFFSSIARLTDNTGTISIKDRYDEFMRMIREWRNLKMLKRAGRGHDPGGVQATLPGQCAVLCPACPQPGINLPPDWEFAPEDKRWLYALFIALDANFRLKRKIVSSEERDPSLGNGWGFFVEEMAYKDHLRANWNQKQERSTCVAHDAVDKPDREARGLAASGAGTVECSRHDFKRPCGVGDLQKGERYLNMDYMFFSSLRDSKYKILVVSYDIACQWHKNLFERMKIFPHEMRMSGTIKTITYLIPKFHLPAHIEDCNTLFSFNLAKGVGRTDGEAPERGWADINPVAQSTKEMGPGSRRDMLDDHFNDRNWKKTVQFGDRMLKKMKEAIPARVEHRLALEDFELAIPAATLEEWRSQVEAWEKDAKATNPYKTEAKAVSEHAVRLQLAREVEETETGRENDLDEIHPSVMISTGLQIEDEQRRLATELSALGQHATNKQLATMAERSNKLRRKIASWIEVQTLYMPAVVLERAKREAAANPDGVAPTKAQNIALWLPSALLDIMPVDESLRLYEWKLREGQAYDSLQDIRHNLRLRSHLLKDKDRFARGVKHNTRSNAAIEKVNAKIDRAAVKYRVARRALLSLSPGLKMCDWQRMLRDLAVDDVRGLSEGLYGDTEGTRRPSWIWTAQGVVPKEGEDPALNDALWIEWCKTRARSMRWNEEVELLEEEMRRILAFLSSQDEWWKSLAAGINGPDAAGKEGLVAYASRQAALRRSLYDRFQHAWRDIPDYRRIAEALDD